MFFQGLGNIILGQSLWEGAFLNDFSGPWKNHFRPELMGRTSLNDFSGPWKHHLGPELVGKDVHK